MARGYFAGDYEGIDTAGSSFVPIFVKTKCIPGAGPCDTGNPTDVVTTTRQG